MLYVLLIYETGRLCAPRFVRRVGTHAAGAYHLPARRWDLRRRQTTGRARNRDDGAVRAGKREIRMGHIPTRRSNWVGLRCSSCLRSMPHWNGRQMSGRFLRYRGSAANSRRNGATRHRCKLELMSRRTARSKR